MTGERAFDGEYIPLSEVEILDFRDQELARAIDYLHPAYDSFIEKAPQGAEFTLSGKLRTLEGWSRIKIEAYVWNDSEEDEAQSEDDRQWAICIDIEEHQDDLTETMISAASGVVPEGSSNPGAPDKDGLGAWSVSSYYFGTDQDCLASVNNYHELQDQDGDPVWSDAESWGAPTAGHDGALKAPLDATELNEFDLLTKQIEKAFSLNDRHKICTALVALGVPSNFFWPEN